MSRILYGMTVVLKTNVPFLPMQSSPEIILDRTALGKHGDRGTGIPRRPKMR
jgi:hypothetical protein